MSANDKTTQLQIGADASEALDAFKKVGQGANEMAQKVGQAGEKAGEGLKKVGDAPKDAPEKIDKATKSIIQSIERATAAAKAGERGTAAYFEAIAKGRGVNADALKPYLDSLRQAEEAQRRAEGSMQNLGLSAKQTTAALRQVPAQFTDIIVSLQGGQEPMTVLLQQGGQLKDVFGGIGPAAKALGGYIAGLVNPLTLAAAAAAALAYGYFKGAEEAQAFNKALVLTGNAAGTTVSQLTAMAERMDGLGTTQGKASEGLLAFLDAGVKGAAGLERYTLAAIKLEQVGGPAVAETAKAFAELGKDPLKAALKLDEATNFLTTSVYKQIKALEEQGKTTEAAKVAQDAYAQAIEGRAPAILERLGAIERAWIAIKNGAAEAADNALFSIGRTESLQQQLAGAQAKKTNARLEQQRQNANGGGGLLGRFLAGRAADQEREADVQIESLNRRLLKEAEITAEQRLQNSQKAASIEADKILEGLADKKAKQAIEEAKVRAVLTEAGKSELDIQKAIAAVREKYADKSKPDNSAAKALEEEAKLLEKVSGLSGTYEKDLQARFDLYQNGKISLDEYILSATKLTAEQPFAKEAERAAKEQAKAAKEVSDEWIRAAASYEKWLSGLNKGTESAQSHIERLQTEAEASDLAAAKNISLAQAIEEVAIARLREKRDKSASDQEREAIDREIAARRQLISEIGKNDERKRAEEALKDLDRFLDPKKADDFGNALTKAFDGAGNSLAKMVNLLESAGKSSDVFAKRRENLEAEKNPAEKLRKQLALNRLAERESLNLYAGLTGAAKGFFDEGTKGYKALEAAETAFRTYQLASDLAKGISAATVAIAKQGTGGDPYTAVPRMAAMAAIMAGLGYVVGFSGSGGSTGGDGAKQATGQGTVFGDAQAKSESIAKSIDLLSDTAKLQLTTQSGMLAALRNIENSIGGVTNQFLRANAGTTAAERFGIKEGPAGLSAFDSFGKKALGIVDDFTRGAYQKLFGRSIKVTGSGLASSAQDLGSIIAGGLNLKDFADITKSRKFLGVTVSSKGSTEYRDADPALARQFGLIFKDFASAITLAANPLEIALDGVTERINNYVVDIGKIDLTGLKGEEIAEKLGAVIGAEGDKIAQAAIPGLQDFQKVGEGYFETVVRVASGVETANAALETLGIGAVKFGDVARKQGDVAAEIVRQSIAAFESLDGSLSSIGAIVNTLDGSADELADTYRSLIDVRDALLNVGESGDALTAIMIRGAGGLENLAGGLSSYFENFFSEEEQATARLARLSEDFARIGVTAIPQTREEFRRLVQGIDTSTDAGQKFFAQVIGLAGAFADAVPAAKALEKSVKTLDYVMTGAGRFDAKTFSAEVAKITTDDIQQSILQLNAADRERAQLNFEIGSTAFLGAYANSLASSRLAKLNDPAPDYGAGRSDSQDPGANLRQKEIDALKSLQDAMQRLDQSLGDFIDGLKFGADSFLSPEQKFYESKAAFESVLKQAKAGDQAAREQVQDRAQTFLDANRAYFGSSQQGADNQRALIDEIQSLREQVRQMVDTAEHGNRIAANGFSGVREATQEGAELTGRALARARLQSLAKVGFES